eukprot:TRINITY_DN4719_c0_g1_i1.p1 TRINITY_DN4719_c0_g1~~TRINITY_DN4719_c0_g1_i1.p1  ORF type:complete len:567 (+),score=137.29 TRINITY_DN4719_c0_g1_i1:202-1701(+)
MNTNTKQLKGGREGDIGNEEEEDVVVQPPITCGHTALWWTGHNGMLVYGGGNDYENLLGHLWFFSLDSLTWTLLNNNTNTNSSSSPPPREFHLAALTKDGNTMIVFGGYNYGYQYFNDLWSLDLESMTWTRLCAECTNAPPARCHAAGTLTNDDSLFVVYGGQDKENVFNDAWAYSFENDVWAPIGNTPYNEPRTGMTSTSVVNYGIDALLSFGGFNGSDPLNSLLLYTPVAAPGECNEGSTAPECSGHGYCVKPSQAIPCETCVLGYGPECGVLPFQDAGMCYPDDAKCVCEYGYGGPDCSPLLLLDMWSGVLPGGGVPGYYCPAPGTSGCDSRGCSMTSNPTHPSTTVSVLTTSCIAGASTELLNLFNNNLLSSNGYFQGEVVPDKTPVIQIDFGYSNCYVKLVRIYFACINDNDDDNYNMINVASPPPVPIFSLSVDGTVVMKEVTIHNCTETGVMEGQHVDIPLVGGYAAQQIALQFQPDTTAITFTQLQLWLTP